MGTFAGIFWHNSKQAFLSTFRAIHEHIERHPSLPAEAVIEALDAFGANEAKDDDV